MKLFQRKGRVYGNTTLVMHIGSGQTSAAVISGSNSGKTHVGAAHQESLILKKTKGSEGEISALKKSLQHCYESLFDPAKKHSALPKNMDVLCVVSSPWFFSQTKIITVEHKQEVKVTADFLHSLIKKETSLFIEELHKSRKSNPQEKLALVEAEIIGTKLNGYDAPEPLEKYALSIEVSILMSLVPESVLNAVRDVCSSARHPHHISFATSSLTFYRVIKNLFPHQSHFILAEIGSEITDVTVVKNNTILETVSFPVGSSTLVRKLSESLNILPDIALSYLSMERSEMLHSKLEADIASAKKALETEWIGAFKSSFASLSQELFVPRDAFIITEQWIGDFFLELVKRTEAKEIAFSANTIEPHLLSAHTLSGFISYEENAPRDSFISLISLFHSRSLLPTKRFPAMI